MPPSLASDVCSYYDYSDNFVTDYITAPMCFCYSVRIVLSVQKKIIIAVIIIIIIKDVLLCDTVAVYTV